MRSGMRSLSLAQVSKSEGHRKHDFSLQSVNFPYLTPQLCPLSREGAILVVSYTPTHIWAPSPQEPGLAQGGMWFSGPGALL